MRRNIIIPPPTFKHHILYPVGIGHYYDFVNHHENRASSILTEYNLHLVLGGKGYIIHEGEKIEMNGGCGFLYTRGAKQHYGTDQDDPWEVCFIHFTAITPLFSIWKLDLSENWFFRFTGIRQVQQIFSSMFELTDTFKMGNEPHLAALVYELLLLLIQNSEPLKKTNTLDQMGMIRQIADSIHDKPEFMWTTAYLAEMSGYSLYHFIRIFHKIMGIKPNEYVKECRIAAAKNLLISSEMTVYEVAEQTGFSQTSYFIKVFKEHTGLSPKVFREMYRLA
ncbi:helix-turn-helix transcriptional regulator [Paenibacillus sp. UASWS1643]|uniref:helix-turn-helix transcriptional regulator n=1 Tax=Paenibacillus sp. UASWS1643 TaxID=2580422 RepID=UPI001238B341|nr:AraC family transcriptional regulator [Paenibacillus sp. UASWS1643]KAA8746165.1 AraC family transcriptional regulator [Paenibacillus sp. UASWS1643]